jgi:hypothetical protein
MERLRESDFDIKDITRKLEFLNKMFDEGRFEDVVTLGSDIETSMENLEITSREKEAKELFDQLEGLMIIVEEMDKPALLKESFQNIRTKYDSGDLEYVLRQGCELLKDLKRGQKTLSLTRAKRIANSIIDARLHISQLRALNIDTIDLEKQVRKAKNLIKEENYLEGVRLLDRVNEEMHNRISDDRNYLRDYVDVYRDALEAVLDRYRKEPAVFMIRKRKIPLLRKFTELGKFRRALEMYRGLEKNFSGILTRDEKKTDLETQLTEYKFELYKRKDLGQDISEPLSLYTTAQKRFKADRIIPAEYLVETSRRYCDAFLESI